MQARYRRLVLPDRIWEKISIAGSIQLTMEKAQAVIRAGEKSGNILVKVSGEGLGTKEVSIHVKEK